MREYLQRRIAGDSGRVIWAIADQCAVSGGNFFTNLILIRSLVPAEFGIYALFLNAINFFNTIHQAFIAYPLCVRGARARAEQFRRITSFALMATTLLIWMPLAPVLSIVGVYLNRSTIILAAVSAMLFWQLQNTLRAGLIARLEQRKALAGDAISYIGQAVLLGLICIRTKPSLSVIFWVVAFTSLIALAVQIRQMRPALPPSRTLRPLGHEFWLLGRWNVVAQLVGFLTLQAFPWLILMRHGRVEVAGFQAILMFLTLTNPLLFSVGNLITATVAKHGTYRLQSVRNYLVLVIGSIVPYLLLLSFLGPYLLRMLYGRDSHYLAYAPLMRIFAAAWLFEVIALSITAILGGLREPRSMFFLQLSGATVAVLIALPWIYWKGLIAAGFAMLLVNAVRAGTGLVLLLRRRSSTSRNGRIEAVDNAETAMRESAETPVLVTLCVGSTLEGVHAEY